MTFVAQGRVVQGREFPCDVCGCAGQPVREIDVVLEGPRRSCVDAADCRPDLSSWVEEQAEQAAAQARAEAGLGWE